MSDSPSVNFHVRFTFIDNFCMKDPSNRFAIGTRLHTYFLAVDEATRLFLYRLIAIIFLLLLVRVPVQGLRTSWYVRSLPTVSDPVTFAKEFNPRRQLEASSAPNPRCKAFRIFCHGPDSEYFESPLFPPRREVETTGIRAGTCETIGRRGMPDVNVSKEGKRLYIDPLWGVFWIGISTCDNLALRGGYFGPYRTL